MNEHAESAKFCAGNFDLDAQNDQSRLMIIKSLNKVIWMSKVTSKPGWTKLHLN